ncbi:MAG: hypothetical protein HY286_19310 [Planctomycetes bacterium]|nr:hypothetical protein [Planctomycetota bacterium]
MDLPIQRVPPMVGPRPAPAIPQLGDRQRQRGDGKFSLEDEESEKDENADDTETTETDPVEAARAEKENAVAPPDEDEAGQNLNIVA